MHSGVMAERRQGALAFDARLPHHHNQGLDDLFLAPDGRDLHAPDGCDVALRGAAGRVKQLFTLRTSGRLPQEIVAHWLNSTLANLARKDLEQPPCSRSPRISDKYPIFS